MRFEETIEIAATAARVWEVMADIARWPEWNRSVRKIQRLDDGPPGVGSAVRIFQPRFPSAVWRITEFLPGRGFAWVCASPGIRVLAKHRIDPTGNGCRVTLSLDYFGVLARILARLTSGITRRYLNYEAVGLKGRCEEQG